MKIVKLSLLVSALVAASSACDFQPAPKQAPPTAPAVGSAAVPGAVAPAGQPPAGVPVDAGFVRPPPADAVQATADCQQAGVKVAQLMIDSAEPSQKPSIERERTSIVRTTEEACTKQGWTEPALACIAQSKSDRDAHACLEKFPPPGATPPAGTPPGATTPPGAKPGTPPPRPHRGDPSKPS